MRRRTSWAHGTANEVLYTVPIACIVVGEGVVVEVAVVDEDL
jgi:hypothetical protein